jgi:outer membrane protein
MLKTTITRQLKTIFLATLLLFGGIAFAQPGITHAAASQVGVVDFQLLIQQHPATAQAQATFQAAVKQAQDDFNAKSAKMNNQDKMNLYQQMNQTLQQKHAQLFQPIFDQVNAAIQAVANAKGLTIVVDKNVVVYGGQDITNDVLKKIKGN